VNDTTGDAQPRVALLTTVEFWWPGGGDRTRIGALVRYLSQQLALSIVVPIVLDAASRQQLAATLPQAVVHTLGLPPRGAARDALAALAGFLHQHPQDACIFEYLILGWLRAAVPPGVLTLVDTHDVVHARDAELLSLGERLDRPLLSASQEQQQLNAFDRVIAISRPDAATFSAWFGPSRVILAPHPTPLRPQLLRSELRHVMFVASAYAPNRDGLQWFLREVWPRLAGLGLVLHVVGIVGPALQLAPAADLRVWGRVDDLEAAYALADLCINPVRCGSGLKIKTVEAMAHGLPLVATSHAVRGLEHARDEAFIVADDAEAFAQAVAMLAARPEERRRLAAGALRLAAAECSEVACFSALLSALRACGNVP